MSDFRLGFIQRVILIALVVGFATVLHSAAPIQQPAENKQSDKPNPFKPLQLFIGKWEGDSKGQPGVGKMEREYAFVLGKRFVQVTKKAVYPRQEKNPTGETHDDLGLLG
jgi:hypothetical protein